MSRVPRLGLDLPASLETAGADLLKHAPRPAQTFKPVALLDVIVG